MDINVFMRNLRIYIIGLLLSYGGLVTYAQNQEKAKQLFNDEKFIEARTDFEKLLKKNPKNGNLNYWYGACLYETGEIKNSLPYLKFATERRIREAYRYLAKSYAHEYRFQEAKEAWESYFSQMEKAKKSIEDFQAEFKQVNIGRQMMRSIQNITVIDSFVVNKDVFLDAYHLSRESGSLIPYNRFFKKEKDTNPEAMVYLTEMKNKIYYSTLSSDSIIQIYTSNLLGNKWEDGIPLQGLPTNCPINYPYMLSDGATFYYAAKHEESLGGYDIFVTRYDAENDRFLRAENIGMPFNSPANDYMYAFDEFNNLGWFATERFQPEGKVCIYVFIPNEGNHTLDENSFTTDSLCKRAKLSSIKDTWSDENLVRKAKQTLATIIYTKPMKEQKKDFELIIDDLTTYYTLDDFRSKEARQVAINWLQMKKDLLQLSKQLEVQRNAYTRSNKNQRLSIAPALLDIEQRVETLEQQVISLEKEIRNSEIRFLQGK